MIAAGLGMISERGIRANEALCSSAAVLQRVAAVPILQIDLLVELMQHSALLFAFWRETRIEGRSKR
jgi:hypothetical protein